MEKWKIGNEGEVSNVHNWNGFFDAVKGIGLCEPTRLVCFSDMVKCFLHIET